jgi:arylsulfatase A-like enzyme
LNITPATSLWLAPEQVRVLTLNDEERLVTYAKEIIQQFRALDATAVQSSPERHALRGTPPTCRELAQPKVVQNSASPFNDQHPNIAPEITRHFMKSIVIAILCALCAFCGSSARAAEKPNILFIAVDDLNHWVGHLGRNPQTKTPNIDRLANMGVTFTRAYCAAPICNPSRTALLTGKRPGVTGVYDNSQPFRQGVKAEDSLVTQFKNGGYDTFGMGKLWHGGLGFAEQWTATAGGANGAGGRLKEDRSIRGIKFGITEGGDEAVPDTRIADYGIAELGKKHDKPFFLTLGFHKPHMPWNVPQKYYDLHPLDKIELPPHRTNDLDDLPPAAVKMAHAFGDHERVLQSGRWKEAVQGYLAAISYLDGQVGRVLDAFDKSDYATNTIICFWGDHGWHLGEKEHWRKFALWEEATRAPFIWVVPGVTKPGGVCDRTVDFMSIYPTLCDLSGVPLPKHVEGANIRPLLANPKAEWKLPAVTTHGFQNHAVRTEQWRYVRYANGDEELYDHTKDEYEFTNLAGKTPEFDAVKKELAKSFPKVNNPALKSRAGSNVPTDPTD